MGADGNGGDLLRSVHVPSRGLVAHLPLAPFVVAVFLGVIVVRIRAEIGGLAGRRARFLDPSALSNLLPSRSRAGPRVRLRSIGKFSQRSLRSGGFVLKESYNRRRRKPVMNNVAQTLAPAMASDRQRPRLLGIFASWRLEAYGYAVAAIYLALLFSAYRSGAWLAGGQGMPLYSDFTDAWVAGREALSGHTALLYNPVEFIRLKKELAGPASFYFPNWPYPRPISCCLLRSRRYRSSPRFSPGNWRPCSRALPSSIGSCGGGPRSLWCSRRHLRCGTSLPDRMGS